MIRIRGRVKNIVGTLVSVDVGEEYPLAWFRWPYGDLQVGQPVDTWAELTGNNVPQSTGGALLNLRESIRIVRLGYKCLDGSLVEREVPWEQKEEDREPKMDGDTPYWVSILVKHKLIDDCLHLDSELFNSGPFLALCCIYPANEAIPRGFIHYDWKWKNSTENVIADFAIGLGAKDKFRLISQTGPQIVFEVYSQDGSTILQQVDLETDPLSETILPCLNHWAEHLGLSRRIFEVDTGTDEIAFICRTPNEMEELKRDGLFDEEDEPWLCGSEGSGDYEDWSDVK